MSKETNVEATPKANPSLDQLTVANVRLLLQHVVGPILKATGGIGGASDDSHWQIGKNYFIRTVTMNHTGRLVKVTDKEIVMEDCAWIPDSGRFSEALAKGTYTEVEMFPKGQTIIGRSALIDAALITGLPMVTK